MAFYEDSTTTMNPGPSTSANEPVFPAPSGRATSNKVFMEDRDKVDWILDSLRSSKPTYQTWRKEADDADKMYVGWQWEDSAVADLESANRPVITFNRIMPIINVILGAANQNRQEVRFIPRHPEVDVQGALSDLATEAVRWAVESRNGDDEREHAFKDCLVRGMGWMEVRLDYEKNADGEVALECWDGMEARWDHTARKQNLEDARWLARKKWMHRKDVYNNWPDKKKDLLGLQFAADDSEDYPDFVEVVSPIAYRPENATPLPGKPPKGYLPVVQFQYYELEDFYRVANEEDPDGDLLEFDKEQFSTLRKRLLRVGKKIPTYVKQQRRVYYQAFLCGDVLLEDEKLPVQDGFTLRCMTGFWDPKDKVWFGLVRPMTDPQRWANKWLSQGLNIINANAKGGLIVEEDAVVNPRQFEEEWSDPTKISFVKPNALKEGKVVEKQQRDFPSAIAELLKYAISAIRDTTGVNTELLGQSEGNEPGVAMRHRQAQGMTILAALFAALTRFRKEEAKIVLAFIRDYIADGRLIRIGGEYNAQSIPLLRDPLTIDYDVIVDESPRNPNVKMEVWSTMSQIAPALFKFGLFDPSLLDYSPLPASVVAKLKAKYEQSQQSQAEALKTSGKYKDPRETEAKIEKLKADTLLQVEKARQIDREASFKQVELALNSQLEALKGQMDMQKAGLDLEKVQAQSAMAQEKHALDQAGRAKKMLTPLPGAQQLPGPAQLQGVPQGPIGA